MTTNNNSNSDNTKVSDMFSEENLRKIPFISNERVTAIVDHIQMHGEPKTVDDFMKIPNIGSGLAQQLQEHFYGKTQEGSDRNKQD